MENPSANNADIISITEAKKILDVKMSMLNGSTLEQVMMNNASFKDVCITGLKITDANLSDLEIEGAQLGGAYIHNIGMPPEGHPAYNPTAKQRPLKFESCDLQGSTITDCNLSGVNISDCNLNGMKINGIDVADLLKVYQKQGE
ncbi:pentapeptide repeat-containing protein [Mucilaginibacter sp. SJ]|uniref:pentapeptide repeat-containing protein n=1 Tax=Mucilaginibacter sp. SJ TaxID=3029053 RepID=UPI0023A95141|nr:pentapeptide repeat-containing protein [Mucilaginibacter sp. SJ]WEA00078.1 pentapeptide repeat-containing protein [Mucilaginibacter sp. SJ]